MTIWGKSFIFNGVPSEIYDLRFFDFDPPNPANSPSGGTVSIMEEWLYRREKPYFYGRYYQESLEFDMVVGSYSYIDGASRDAIQTWLVGRSSYLPLRIVQDDISDIVYNVIFTQSTKIDVGGLNYAIMLHAKCDRPWAVSYPAATTITNSSASSIYTTNFDFVNGSTYSGYNKPTITFTMGTLGGNLSIVNASDSDRNFAFTDLAANEIITVDNDRGIITSSGSSLRMANFNKNFFRAIQGINDLTVSGSIVSLTITPVFAKGVGA